MSYKVPVCTSTFLYSSFCNLYDFIVQGLIAGSGAGLGLSLLNKLALE
jgi:hypothetical protein